MGTEVELDADSFNGDNYPNGFSQGRTMRGAETTSLFHYDGQVVEVKFSRSHPCTQRPLKHGTLRWLAEGADDRSVPSSRILLEEIAVNSNIHSNY